MRLPSPSTLTLILGAAALLLPATLFAANPVNKSFFGDVAIEGYDAVAYFTAGKPVEGTKEHTVSYQDANWRFASAENRALFAADPEKYAPQYGGYCAFAVANGSKAGIDPESWKVVDGKLYLNYSKAIQKKWLEDVPGFIEKADANWAKLRDE